MVTFECKICHVEVYEFGLTAPPEDGLCAECRYVEALPDEATKSEVRRVLARIEGSMDAAREGGN